MGVTAGFPPRSGLWGPACSWLALLPPHCCFLVPLAVPAHFSDLESFLSSITRGSSDSHLSPSSELCGQNSCGYISRPHLSPGSQTYLFYCPTGISLGHGTTTWGHLSHAELLVASTLAPLSPWLPHHSHLQKHPESHACPSGPCYLLPGPGHPFPLIGPLNSFHLYPSLSTL